MAEPAGENLSTGEQPAPPRADATTEAFERAIGERVPVSFEFILYVAGSGPRSLRAVATVRRLCEEYLPATHTLEVVDIYQQPSAVIDAAILAVPLLIKMSPPPVQKFVGDMSQAEPLVRSLGPGPVRSQERASDSP